MGVNLSGTTPGNPSSGGIFDDMMSGAGSLGQGLWNGLQGLLDGIGNILGGAAQFVGSAFDAVVTGAINLVSTVSNLIGNTINKLFGPKPVPPPEPLPDLYSPIQADLESAFEPLLSTVNDALTGSSELGEKIDGAIDDLADLVDPDNEDSKLWQAQNAIDRLQNERDAIQDIALDAQARALEALQQYVTRVMFLPDVTKVNSVQNPHWMVTFENGKRLLTAKDDPGWVGEWVYNSAVHRSGDFGPVIEGGTVSAASRTFLLDTATSSATLLYTIRPGIPRLAYPGSVSGWTPARDTWTNLPVSDSEDGLVSGVFTATTAGEHDIFIRAGWHATTRDDSYGIRIQRTSASGAVTYPKEIKQVGIGPLLHFQNGYRTQSIQMTLNLAVDEKITFQAWAGATGIDQRTMRDSEISVGWVQAPPDNSDIT
ncbi:hypothetical protein FGG66_gp18 [Corynebacterium phage phi674]|uniref:Uncharacterized protein n=1 Tax=Corynebacterium phage phi674 TaxID=2052822 RepID=A0A2H4PJ06_9CAUD|nr:hypothetical protein FGG66_gp18 [Corynebacterium phage phi674]ATW62936.1 hypothetical protein phi674_gp18 [Corynebacterium phage phi674]